MPRGCRDPKRMKEIGQATQFRPGENAAKEASEKGNATKKEYATLKETLLSVMTEDKRKAMCETIVDAAIAGNTRAWEIVRDMMGEKPVEKIEQTINEIAFRVEGVSPEEADEIFG